MTRADLQDLKDYYSATIPSSVGGTTWVQIPRDGLLDLIDSLEAAWKERDEYKQHLASMLDEQAKRRESIGIRQSPEETAFWDNAERNTVMTREQLQDIKAWMKVSRVDSDQAHRLIDALEAAWGERDEGYGYLFRLLCEVTAPTPCQPLDTVLGVATQIDNYIAGLRKERDQLLVERASVVDWTNTQLREHGLVEIKSPRIMEDTKFAIGLLSETAHKHAIERDQLKHRVRELECGEYICKKCGLRKDSEPQPADF